MRVFCQHWVENNFHCSQWWWKITQHGIIHTFGSQSNHLQDTTRLFNREFMPTQCPHCDTVNRVLGISASCYFRAFCGGATRSLLAIQNGCGGAGWSYSIVVELSRSGIDKSNGKPFLVSIKNRRQQHNDTILYHGIVLHSSANFQRMYGGNDSPCLRL